MQDWLRVSSSQPEGHSFRPIDPRATGVPGFEASRTEPIQDRQVRRPGVWSASRIPGFTVFTEITESRLGAPDGARATRRSDAARQRERRISSPSSPWRRSACGQNGAVGTGGAARLRRSQPTACAADAQKSGRITKAGARRGPSPRPGKGLCRALACVDGRPSERRTRSRRAEARSDDPRRPGDPRDRCSGRRSRHRRGRIARRPRLRFPGRLEHSDHARPFARPPEPAGREARSIATQAMAPSGAPSGSASSAAITRVRRRARLASRGPADP